MITLTCTLSIPAFLIQLRGEVVRGRGARRGRGGHGFHLTVALLLLGGVSPFFTHLTPNRSALFHLKWNPDPSVHVLSHFLGRVTGTPI